MKLIKTFSKPYQLLAVVLILLLPGAPTLAQTCLALETTFGGLLHDALEVALKGAAPDAASNGGLDTNMWGTIVDRDGVVCAVAFSGDDRGDQWPGSRAISAQKANTANSFSLDDLALSTANLFSAVQPGGFLYGLQHSNPVDTGVAYKGPSKAYGQHNDPMVGKKIGGVNVFGGGLGLYDANELIVGAVGVSGDTSCADHVVAWRTRDALFLDNVPGGVSPTGDDNIIFDIVGSNGNFHSRGGFGHPECGFGETGPGEDLPSAFPIG